MLEQIADLTAGQRDIQDIHLVLVNENSTVVLQWSVGGYYGGLVLGDVRDTAPRCSSEDS